MTVGTGVITGYSISHSHANVDTIETACSTPEADVIESLLDRPGVTEAVCLQTCNRAEAYVVTDSPEVGRAALRSVVADVPDDTVCELGHETALWHLMSVACGLESLVLGEDQILGQLREAYLRARSMGALGPVLEAALTKSLHVGERARTETAINEGVVSLGSAAARLADREVALCDATVLVVGAGEMGKIAANAVATDAARLVIANRTVEHATHIAQTIEAVDTEAIGLASLPRAISEAAVVVSATASDAPIIDRALLDGSDIGPTLFIDIAQPRDVAPAVTTRPETTLYDLDTLESITSETTETRQAAAKQVEEMIETAMERLLTQYKRKQADAVIAAMYEGAQRMKQQELSTAFSQLETDDELTPQQRETVESLADALVSQLLAAPTKSLRDAAERDDWSTINTALQLFDPRFEAQRDQPHQTTKTANTGVSADADDD